jgi:hypothetical protein
LGHQKHRGSARNGQPSPTVNIRSGNEERRQSGGGAKESHAEPPAKPGDELRGQHEANSHDTEKQKIRDRHHPDEMLAHHVQAVYRNEMLGERSRADLKATGGQATPDRKRQHIQGRQPWHRRCRVVGPWPALRLIRDGGCGGHALCYSSRSRLLRPGQTVSNGKVHRRPGT